MNHFEELMEAFRAGIEVGLRAVGFLIGLAGVVSVAAFLFIFLAWLTR